MQGYLKKQEKFQINNIYFKKILTTYLTGKEREKELKQRER